MLDLERMKCNEGSCLIHPGQGGTMAISTSSQWEEGGKSIALELHSNSTLNLNLVVGPVSTLFSLFC
jgi:hypothetical protein